MQNRLVLRGIPLAVPRLPKASDSLKDLLEDHACWVDRFAFLSTPPIASKNSSAEDAVCVTAAAELHIENVRDKAIKLLNGMVVCMDREGGILDDDSNTAVGDDGESEANDKVNNERSKYISFRIHAHPANDAQSAELIQKCPLQSDGVAGEERMEEQTLRLPLLPLDRDDVELIVRRSEEHGGTGTYPWRGGLILSRQMCHWAANRESPRSSCDDGGDGKNTTGGTAAGRIDFESLFCGKRVLELGAGAAGLPSMTLGKICDALGYNMDLVASDGIDEIVTALRANVRVNGLDDCVRVERIDWNDYRNIDGKERIAKPAEADTIVFADCIYNEECAVALGRTISRLMKPGGHVLGVLPDFRVGLNSFEKQMKEDRFVPADIQIIATEDGDFACSGGSGRDYRLVLWRDNS